LGRISAEYSVRSLRASPDTLRSEKGGGQEVKGQGSEKRECGGRRHDGLRAPSQARDGEKGGRGDSRQDSQKNRGNVNGVLDIYVQNRNWKFIFSCFMNLKTKGGCIVPHTTRRTPGIKHITIFFINRQTYIIVNPPQLKLIFTNLTLITINIHLCCASSNPRRLLPHRHQR